ncbi:MAG TPA: hypothetical protein VF531_05315 [Bacillota bacterium]
MNPRASMEAVWFEQKKYQIHAKGVGNDVTVDLLRLWKTMGCPKESGKNNLAECASKEGGSL